MVPHCVMSHRTPYAVRITYDVFKVSLSVANTEWHVSTLDNSRKHQICIFNGKHCFKMLKGYILVGRHISLFHWYLHDSVKVLSQQFFTPESEVRFLDLVALQSGGPKVQILKVQLYWHKRTIIHSYAHWCFLIKACSRSFRPLTFELKNLQ